MDVRSLSCFVAVAEELHFHRAAKRVFLSQPAFSARIRSLEDEVGVTLLERDRRRVTLTPAGVAFLEPARSALRHAIQAKTAAQRAARGETGSLRLGFSVIAFHGVLPQVLREFRSRHPEVALELVEMNSPSQELALAAGEIDLGVLHPPLATPGLSMRPIASEPLVLALPSSHPLARRKVVKMSDLECLPFLIAPRRIGPQIYDRVIAHFQAAEFSPHIVQEATPMTTLVGLVAAGVGVGFVTAGIASVGRGGVVFREVSPKPPELPMALAWRDGALSQVGQRLVELMLAMAGQAQRLPRKRA